jgi:glycosyltransferase involved in cell wall biosynthesis
MGHEVVVFCQDPDPGRYDLGAATVVRPEIGRLLPVFVRDRYEGFEPRLLQDLTPGEREHFVEANAAAIRHHLPADLVFTTHVLLGAPVGAAVGAPFVVKAHGSELEFSMRESPQLCDWARETLAGAAAVFAGSEHIRTVLQDVVGQGAHSSRLHVVPPGVDVDSFRPRTREEARRELLAEARRDSANPRDDANERLPDAENAARFERFFRTDAPTVVYFGKLSREKGVHLLIEALGRIQSRAVIVGFGAAREELEELARAHAPDRVLFTGALEHRHLVHLLPLADVTVVPSIFPEAFGMVAAEAASAGSIPLVANHSGLAEVAAGLGAEYPAERAHLTSFLPGDVDDLTVKLRALLSLGPRDQAQLQEAARGAALKHWSWEHVGAALLEASGLSANP